MSKLTSRIVALTAAVALVAATVSGAAAADDFSGAKGSSSIAPNAQTLQQLGSGDGVGDIER
jgi:hypothetical protein